MRYVTVTFILLLCVASAAPGDAVDPEWVGGEPLRQGAFLFASPGLRDPNFFQTVVLLVTYGEGGASGLIINRPTRIPLPKALPDIEGIEKLSQPVYFGGPVNLDHMLALLRTDGSLPDAQKVLADIYFTANRKTLTDALQNRNPGNTIRVYAGYSGWGPGQLDREFTRGDWVILDGDPESVFAEDPSKIWSTFFESKDKIQIRFPKPASRQKWVRISAETETGIRPSSLWISPATGGFPTGSEASKANSVSFDRE